MQTIKVQAILSEQGLLKIHDYLKGNSFERHSGLIIEELSTGKTFENFGGFNGNYTDLWLRKIGTKVSTSKTFIRVSLGNYSDISLELKWLKIQPSQDFQLRLQWEQNEILKKETDTQNYIANFSDLEKAKKWIEKDNKGNSHTRKTRWANRLQREGFVRGFGSDLRDKCYQLIAQ